MTKKIIYVFVTLSFFMFFGFKSLHAEPSAAAAKSAGPPITEEKKEDSRVLISKEITPVKVTMEKVSGEVSSISLSSVTIAYETTESAEYEMMIPFSEDLKLSGYKKVSDIKLKDVVDVDYEKKIENQDTENMRISKSIKSIALVKKAEEEKTL